MPAWIDVLWGMMLKAFGSAGVLTGKSWLIITWSTDASATSKALTREAPVNRARHVQQLQATPCW